jgi:hypothetical protein
MQAYTYLLLYMMANRIMFYVVIMTVKISAGNVPVEEWQVFDRRKMCQ